MKAVKNRLRSQKQYELHSSREADVNSFGSYTYAVSCCCLGVEIELRYLQIKAFTYFMQRRKGRRLLREGWCKTLDRARKSCHRCV